MPSLRLNETAERGHDDLAGAACWNSKKDLYTASEGGLVRKWNVKGDCTLKTQTGASNCAFSITCLHAPARESVTHSLAAACTDGCLRLLTPSGKVEKCATLAHTGAVIRVCWNHSGTALASGGEDGVVKTWSATGMIRATIAHEDKPIYGLAWSPEDAMVAFSAGAYVCVEPTESAVSKPFKWLALEENAARAGAVVLAIDWCNIHRHLVTTGEDCRYAVWDDNGILLFRSDSMGMPPIAVAWRPQGDSFMLGLHNQIILCDAAGWQAAQQSHTCGGAHAIAWAPGGMLCGIATGSGAVLLSNILDLDLQNGSIQVLLKDTNTVDVVDIASGMSDSLDFSEQVDAFAMGHSRLVVATGRQARVYTISTSGGATVAPAATVDIGDVLLDIKLAARCFLLLFATTGPQVYDYQGKLLCAPRAEGLSVEALAAPMVALSSDTLALLHPATRTSVHFFHIAGGHATAEPLRIRRDDDSRRLVSDGNVAVMDITSIALSQSGSQADRLLAFVDSNADLYVCSVLAPTPVKLAGSVTSYAWNDAADILAAASDGHLLLWYCPEAAIAARDLLEVTRERRAALLGASPTIEAFVGAAVSVRQSDGTRIAAAANSHAIKLYSLIQHGRWDAALQLCRFLKLPMLWACLAAAAMKGSHLEHATAAFAAIDQVDKVVYLRNVQAIPNHHVRRAELLLLQGKHAAAEEALVSNRLVWAAIDLNMRLFSWERALAIAEQSDDPLHAQSVLWHRAHHLQLLNKDPLKGGKNHECLEKFARLFNEQGIPPEKNVKVFIDAQRTKEGLDSSG
eukprot:jgi/Ulvmu1/3892/UM018_0113.1